MGFLGNADLVAQLQSADVLLHCSVAETFGLVYLEAAEEGLPVVSTYSDVAAWMIPNFVPGRVSDRNPKTLASAVLHVLDEPGASEEARLARERRRDTFSPEIIVGKWSSKIMDCYSARQRAAVADSRAR